MLLRDFGCICLCFDTKLGVTDRLLLLGFVSRKPFFGLQVQQMMKVKAEREDLRQDNAKLQSDVRKLQRQLDAKQAEPVPNTESDGKLQEQLQMLEDEKAALQEQLQQHVQRAAPAAIGAAPPGPLQEGQQGYPQTWKLVDQLRNQNRSALPNTPDA